MCTLLEVYASDNLTGSSEASQSEVLKKISVNQLTVGMFVHGFDAGWLSHPFWRGKFAITDDAKIQEIKSYGLQDCWIDVAKGVDVPASPQPAAVPERVRPAPPSAAPPAPVALQDELKQAARLRARSAQAMRQLFSEIRLGNAIQEAECAHLVDDVVGSINRHPDALLSLLRLKTADEYTYLHSVAVCALMVALGRQLGLNETQCHAAGMAGMLHDLGKAAMPQDVLNKPGKLTNEEFEIIKQHPVRGEEMLRAAGMVSESVLDVCRHHHERYDGKGYPDGLKGEGISLLARMGAICDVYDAVTSDRPYKKAWDPAHALSQMATWEGHFDVPMFRSFVKCLGIYPTGSLVRLSSGRLALVLEQNPHELTRPRVKVFFSTKADMPIERKIVDLAARDVTDQIVAREPVEKWNFPYLNELWGADEALLQG